MRVAGDNRVVLAIGAHPDDVEISCAGTLCSLKANGYSIHIATMTLGDCGSKDIGVDDICRKRKGEAQAAAEKVGAQYYYAGSHDFAIFHDNAHNRRVTALLRDIQPSIVLTHQPHDYIVDHEMTSTIVRNACFYAPAPNYGTPPTMAGAIVAIPTLYYWDVIEGVDIYGKPVMPQFYIDVTEHEDMKAEMLACHASQRDWLQAQHGMDEYLESMKAWGRKRGSEAGQIANRAVGHAEAFRQHLGHAYPRKNVFADVLGEAVISNPNY